ncbi:MAG: hypothetical protein ACO24O_04710 [Arenimonas sp.]|uniref:hypothetical protein n=1 Tax=Arenimonas sp. TaxID=1872635 RepID=UPI003BFACD03
MKRLFLLSAVLVSSLAYASKDLDREAVQVSVAAGNIPQQRQQVEAKLTQVEYVELTKESRAILDAQFDLLEASPLTADQGLAAQNRINGILKQAFADSKLVCNYEQTLGSNMKKRTCLTMAAKKRNYDRTQRNLEMQKTPSNPYGSQ